METVSLLLCGAALALPHWSRADGCRDHATHKETPSADQPFAFSCTHPPQTSGRVQVTWYKYPSKTPVSKSMQTRIYQDRHWILFLPLEQGDSGIYQCLIHNESRCYQICVNLTVSEAYQCGTSRKSQMSVSHEYKQILHAGKNDSLSCHLNFPKSCELDSVKWFKDCKEITGARFANWARNRKLLVSNVSTEDGGNYACEATLTHAGRRFTVSQRIAVTVSSALIVNCNITDARGNTNLRRWRVNGTLVDTLYPSRRIQEGIETYFYFQEYNFYTVNITFLEVKMEDYGHPFTCHAGVSSAHFTLRPPVPDFRAHLTAGLLAFAVLAGLATYFYHTYRIDVALWYRSAFPPAGAVQDGKLYDAYVLYPKPLWGSRSCCVDTLVLKGLPEVLERQCGYQLFISGRDEFPGQAVASAIDENIRLCRRLIIVIVPESPGFDLLKNLSEEQIAVYNALIQDAMKVILIEVERVKSYAAMPESIQYIKQKHGSVQWSGDFTEHSLCAKSKFWKKVRYSMPPKRFPPPPQCVSS